MNPRFPRRSPTTKSITRAFGMTWGVRRGSRASSSTAASSRAPLEGNTVASADDPEGDDLVPLSALNALLYCARRAALRHLDALYAHNEHTRLGEIGHRRADKAGYERRPGTRTERGLWIASRRLRLYGR